MRADQGFPGSATVRAVRPCVTVLDRALAGQVTVRGDRARPCRDRAGARGGTVCCTVCRHGLLPWRAPGAHTGVITATMEAAMGITFTALDSDNMPVPFDED